MRVRRERAALTIIPDRSAFEILSAEVMDMDPGELDALVSTLGPDDLAVIERVLAEQTRAGWRSSPIAMARELTRGKVQEYPYAKLLSEKFVDAVELRSPRQVWNLPARYGKSTIASRWGPTWALDRDPTSSLILASYGDDLANENAVIVRDNLRQYSDVLSCRLKVDRQRMDRFVTEQGGGLIAAGIGSGLTGFGGNGAVVDDPFKNWVEAHSEAKRKEVWDWFRTVLYLRMDEIQLSWIIIVMTRWHEEDLSGKVLEAAANEMGDEYEHVRLPAICDDPANDPLGRQLGEPLEPARFPIEAVLQRARTLGTYLAAGLEQQKPAPEEGEEIKRGWWKWYAPGQRPPRFDAVCSSWDLKLKDKEQGDYVVGQVWGRVGSSFWLLDSIRGQWNQTQAKTAIALLAIRNSFVRAHVVENTGNAPEVMAELRRPQPGYVVSEDTRSALGITDAELPLVNALFERGLTGLIPETPVGSKQIRARAQSPLIEGGNVWLPEGKEFAEALVNEAAVFPNGTHDDQVDAWSQAMKRLSGGNASVQRGRGQVQTPAPGARALPPEQRVARRATQGARVVRRARRK